MKKLTLNEAWEKCLACWKIIAEGFKPELYDDRREIYMYVFKQKKDIVKSMGDENITNDCYFCEYISQNSNNDCASCPGFLVDFSFSCSNKSYSCYFKPIEFYKELLRLNEIRLKLKDKKRKVCGQ